MNPVKNSGCAGAAAGTAALTYIPVLKPSEASAFNFALTCLKTYLPAGCRGQRPGDTLTGRRQRKMTGSTSAGRSGHFSKGPKSGRYRKVRHGSKTTGTGVQMAAKFAGSPAAGDRDIRAHRSNSPAEQAAAAL